MGLPHCKSPRKSQLILSLIHGFITIPTNAPHRISSPSSPPPCRSDLLYLCLVLSASHPLNPLLRNRLSGHYWPTLAMTPPYKCFKQHWDFNLILLYYSQCFKFKDKISVAQELKSSVT
eukprot:758480-Hanusia_phi.AAC.3